MTNIPTLNAWPARIAALLLAATPLLHAAGGNDTTGWQVSSTAAGLQRITTPGIDRDGVELEDIKRQAAGEPLRFAIPLQHSITPSSHGTWDTLAPGLRRWRLEIASPDAHSINLGFVRYRLPQGAALRILDAAGKPAMRAFTAADNDEHGQLWTPIVPGAVLGIELTVPAAVAQAVSLELGSINHGYRAFGQAPGLAGSTGSCNIDAVCPQGDDWRDQMQSSAAISTGGSTFCSGALINNVENDGRAFFLTANHCGIQNAASLVAYWNYRNSTCRPPATSGNPGDGSLAQFNSGAIFRARRAQSDFLLVEFDDPIDRAFGLYLSGFDARNQATASAVAIHHPDGQEMRISVENEPTVISTFGGGSDTTHLRVPDWDLGTTEPGSAGSPLYSPEKRIVGQLQGGGAACGNNESDYYGRLAVSWSGGDSPASRLRDWLDPNNTGTLVQDGSFFAPFDVVLGTHSVHVCSIDPSFSTGVSVVAIAPDFDDDVVLSVSDAPAGLGVALNPDTLAPGDDGELVLSGFDALGPGTFGFDVVGTSGTSTTNRAVTLHVSTGLPAVPLPAYPAVDAIDVPLNVTFAWAPVAGAATYRVEVATDPGFTTPVFDGTTDESSLRVTDELALMSTYYWRVSAISPCGTGTASAVRQFSTGSAYCDLADLDIPIGTAADALERSLVLPGGSTVADVRIPFAAAHDWIGDLVATISHAGTTRTLLDNPGVPATANGCGGKNPDIVFDDSADLAAETDCASADPGYTIGGAYRPNQSLDAFAGSGAGGAWTLRIHDIVNVDNGRLVRWCVEVEPAEIFTDGFE